MAMKYSQGVSVSSTRFTKAPMGEVQFSRFYGEPIHDTTMNAGDIVPIYCSEVLPHDTISMEVDEVIRQATLKVPVMDEAVIDVYAYFVPNRVVNKSWVNVMGENTSGAWYGEDVSLAPLMGSTAPYSQIPVGSVADYYGFPTQALIPREVLQSCHDLKFRGYLDIYNNYFRDENYQPPIAYSKLNVYNGFLDSAQEVPFDPTGSVISISDDGVSLDTSGGVGLGAVGKALFDSETARLESRNGATGTWIEMGKRTLPWRAYNRPLKANKMHDYFTTVLPSPQKGKEALLPLTGGIAPVIASNAMHSMTNAVKFEVADDAAMYGSTGALGVNSSGTLLKDATLGFDVQNFADFVSQSNLNADLSQALAEVSISDIRTSAAVQQVFEILGRSGSRYTEYVNAFFGLDTENPFLDIPTCLGHIRRKLDLYQTAQTSATTETSAQGDLAAFGYTATGGNLFTRTFLEHGYIHIMAVIRQRNIYPAMLSRDNFRLSMMDFYQYPLANISEQPVYTREINPFAGNTQVFGYQEAWAEYRTEPDRVSGYIRPGINLSLSQWTYADDFDSELLIADGNFMQSNAEQVIARGVANVDEYAPQFKAKFSFKITKQRPLPTYSIPGMDII